MLLENPADFFETGLERQRHDAIPMSGAAARAERFDDFPRSDRISLGADFRLRGWRPNAG
jgi:hypothetical protein